MDATDKHNRRTEKNKQTDVSLSVRVFEHDTQPRVNSAPGKPVSCTRIDS